MKRIVILLSVLFIGTFLVGCSPAARNGNQIKEYLAAHRNFVASYIDNLEIIRRETEVRENIDSVWVNVMAYHGDILYKLSYALVFDLTDDGWVLQRVDRYEAGGSWDKTLPTRERVLADARNALATDGFITSRGLSIDENISLSGFPAGDEPALTSADNRSPEFRIGVTAQNGSALFELEYTFDYFIGVDGWRAGSLNLISTAATPIDTIAQWEIDNFVSQLQDELAGYDITLASRTTDLAHNFDELVFSASLQHLNATEVRTVFLPTLFDTRQGEWHLLYHSISEPIFQDWDIVGSYTVSFSDNNNRHFTLVLNITNMTDTMIYADGSVLSRGLQSEYEYHFDTAFPFSYRISFIDFDVGGFVTRFGGWGGTGDPASWRSNQVTFRVDGAHLMGWVWGSLGWGYSPFELHR